MKTLFLSLFLILLLIPVSSSFSQETYDQIPAFSIKHSDNPPTVYQDNEGYAVVVGEIENLNELSAVSNVILRVNYIDEYDQLVDVNVSGTSVLDVIPTLGTSPYIIRSNSPSSNEIASAEVTIEGFDSSASKEKKLVIESSDVTFDENFELSGILKNVGDAPTKNSKVHIAFYQEFDPPRIVDVFTVPVGDIEIDGESSFEFNEKIDQRASSFVLLAESDIFYSDFVELKVPENEKQTKLVTISDVTIKNTVDMKTSEIIVGQTVFVQSNAWIQFSADQKSNETPYTYYVQIKQFGIPYVEFLGKYDGRYIGAGTQTQSLDWIPENRGLFFVETFVWDRENTPIADPGPVILVEVK